MVVQVMGGTQMNAHQVGKKLAPLGYPTLLSFNSLKI